MSDQNLGFGPIDRARHRLLVVDDDPVSRYTTVRWLESAGFRTREATNGAEGLKFADADISAMVLDVHLPDIDGFELCRLLRTQPLTARLPILHLSAAHVTDEDKVKGLDSGADAYLTHPVDPAVLVASIQALVRARVAEDAMRQSEAQFRAIYARAPGGICLLDRNGCFSDANPAMLDFLRQPLEAVVGKPLTEFVPADRVQKAKAFMQAAHAGEARDEFPVTRGAGEVLYLQWSMLPEIQPGLNMVLATDISERTELEHQRQQALQREREARSGAEKLSRMKDELIAVLSHELRTPLTAISGWVHVLRKRDDDKDIRERGLDAIDRNVRLQARLVSDLLDMSSMNLGKMRLTVEDVDALEVVNAAVAALTPSIEEKGLKVEVVAPAAYPTLRADPARLQQVVSNLLGNAIKFSDKAGHIRITVKGEGAGVLLSFADEGKGIAPDFLPLLFERFSQADASSNRRQGGLGLGLSIVRHLVESHDGKVTVESPGLGMGTTFSVWLPESGPEHRTESGLLDTDGQEPHDPESMLAGTRLLVVDDDPDICAMLQIILGDRGAEVAVAHDYDAALLSLQETAPHLLVSDVGMPGNDGYALIREVRRREGTGSRLPAIALTSYARTQDRDQALVEGFDAHCQKPVRPLQLVQEIRHLLARE